MPVHAESMGQGRTRLFHNFQIEMMTIVIFLPGYNFVNGYSISLMKFCNLVKHGRPIACITALYFIQMNCNLRRKYIYGS